MAESICAFAVSACEGSWYACAERPATNMYVSQSRLSKDVRTRRRELDRVDSVQINGVRCAVECANLHIISLLGTVANTTHKDSGDVLRLDTLERHSVRRTNERHAEGELL